jgi:hypothetical protein
VLYIFLFVLAIGLYTYLNQKTKTNSIKQNGIRTVGTIIQNKETQNRLDQLGGNINEPTIKFITKDGQEIIGKPVVGFTSQHEVMVPGKVSIIYDSKNPQKFFLDME